MTRSPAPRAAAGAAGRPAAPRGARIPRPALPLWCARAAVVCALAVALAHPWAISWAEATRTAGAQSTAPAVSHATLGPIVAELALAALTPATILAARLLAAAGLLAMGVELLAAAAGMAAQRRAGRRTPATYLRIRAQAPVVSAASGRMAGATAPSGDQFYRALLPALPPSSGRERLLGRAPWVALTLTGQPDRPVEIGCAVADADDARRAETVMRIRALVEGQAPGAQIDEAPDPLRSGLEPGVRVAWREYGLALPPHYPLRALDDIAGSDLLGPLVAALKPHGTLRTEAQLILRPGGGGALHAGWRGRATALLLNLQAKNDYALSADIARVEAKLDAAPFEATLRIVVAADGPGAPERLSAALGQIEGVLGQYAQRTSHHLQTLARIGAGRASLGARASHAALARAPRFAPPPAGLLPLRPWRDSATLSAIEAAGLWHLPAAGLGHHVRWLNNRYIPAPHEAFTGGEADRVTVGLAKHADGRVAPVGPTWRDLRQVLHITAGMGAGKTRLLANVCRQAIPLGFLLLDGKGDDAGGSLVARVRRQIPLGDERRLVVFDILDTTWPIGLNPLAGIDFAQPGAKTQALGQIMAIFSRLDAGWSAAPGMQEYVLNAALLVFEGQRSPTLAHVKQALLDQRYRARLLTHCTNPEVRTYWEVEHPQHGEKQKTSLFALMRRFARLLTDETTRYLVSQAVPRLSLLQAIEEGKIVLAPMPHQTLGTIAGAVGMLLLQAVLRAAMMRGGDDQSRTTYPLIVDELQIFIGEDEKNKDMEMATSQLRSFGIAGVYAHQTISQLGPLESEMLTNSGSRVILRTQEPDASTYARKYADRGVTAADISGQDPEEHQYADLLVRRTSTKIFSMITLGWPDPVEVVTPPYDGPDWKTVIPPDSPNATFDREVCALVYGRHKQPDLVAARLAAKSEAEWQQVLHRWAAVRDCQRQYMLHNPGCIPERLERQRWLSRLGYATPAILAEAEYARIRREIAPEGEADLDEQASALSRQGSGQSKGAKGRGVSGSAEPPQRAHLRHVDPERAGDAGDPTVPDDLYGEDDDAW